MTVLQKAVLPGMSDAYLTRGFDRVGGFVVAAADVAWAQTPADLRTSHRPADDLVPAVPVGLGVGLTGPTSDTSEERDRARVEPQ